MKLVVDMNLSPSWVEWLVFTSRGSRALDEAVTAGAGRVENLELGHRYGHLSLWLPSPETPHRREVDSIRQFVIRRRCGP